MNRSELLDKLALELVEWPTMWDSENQEKFPEVIEWQLYHSPYLCGDDLEKIFPHEWLQRRNELINCPPDSEAPSWAKWKAQDSYGFWRWFEAKPFVGNRGWDVNIQLIGFQLDNKGAIPAGHNWRATLTEVNHMEQPHEADARRLDAQLEEDMKNVTTAHSILCSASRHMNDRAATYDKPEGERSMRATVQAFNIMTDNMLTEEQGWLFMQLLKAVRSQQGAYRADSYEDGAAYVALAGEAAAKERT